MLQKLKRLELSDDLLMKWRRRNRLEDFFLLWEWNSVKLELHEEGFLKWQIWSCLSRSRCEKSSHNSHFTFSSLISLGTMMMTEEQIVVKTKKISVSILYCFYICAEFKLNMRRQWGEFYILYDESRKSKCLFSLDTDTEWDLRASRDSLKSSKCRSRMKSWSEMNRD